MGNMFQSPKSEPPPKQPEPTPLPIRDDEAARKEKLKTYAAASKRVGAESTRMGYGRMGDSDSGGGAPTTRSSILGAG